MAPVATEPQQQPQAPSKPDNFYYQRAVEDDPNDPYPYKQFRPRYPDVKWPKLEPFDIEDRGLRADPEKKSLLSAASKVVTLNPTIGTDIYGVDLRALTETQKDELALLVAERGVVFFRNQELNVYEQLELARYYGPLHKHPTSGVPKEEGLEEVHLVYSENNRRARDPSQFSKLQLWHSDVSYELQPPSTTSLKVITGPDTGGDTLWSSGYALYSSFSRGFQVYLEGLKALHSAVAQADGARANGMPVRREPVETEHPVVRVHPVTGWKSIYVNPGFTRRIIGVPKAESDAVLQFLFEQIAHNIDFHARIKWGHNDVAIWDNRIVTHTATYDYWPATRHALRATPQGERPTSVEDYEKNGKVAKDRQLEIWKAKGVEIPEWKSVLGGIQKPRGYND